MEFSRKRWIETKLGVLAAAIALGCYGQVPVQFNMVASKEIGHAKLQLVTTAPNLVEGRELSGPFGVVIDSGVTPGILYISDTSNNRVLAWRNVSPPNGAKADFVVGQNDVYATLPLGPGTTSSTGLRSPTGIAVDSRGNLFVVDTGNNRILRYARPNGQAGDLIQPNLVIGQSSFSASSANQGLAAPSAKSLFFASGSTIFSGAMVFDGSGNLWVADPGNNRILRFPASAIGDSASNAPEADLVLGQTSFTLPQTVDWNQAASRSLKSAIYRPSALAVDPAGRLLAGDSANRLLVYTPPFRTGMDAARIAGLYVNVQGQPAKPQVNEYTLFGPEGIFATSAGIFVVEGISNRIVRHDPFDQWPAETDLVPSPAAKAVFGQPDMFSARANRGGLEANETGFAAPAGVAVAGSEVYVADSGNNRVLALPLNGGNVGGATRVLGQISLNYRSINMTDGAGLYLAAGGTSIPGTGNVVVGGAVIIDRSSNPPHLYIADTFNNRVLGFADARSAKQGDQADVVIGQTSQYEARVNSPTSNPDQLTDQGLFAPIGVAVDASGNLYVADSGNGRVLRFPKPFEQAQKFGQRADLVLGQSGFNIKIVDATQRNMSRPYGLAFTVDGHLMASDVAHNRVLLFRKSASGDFSNGQPAGSVFGQRDFTTSSAGAEETRFNAPMHIASDTDDRLYVCDPGNRRVAIFDRVLFATTNPSPAITLATAETATDRLGLVQGINVSSRTGEIWVADTTNNRVLRFPRFDVLTLTPAANYRIPTNLPLAVSIDAFDNLLIAEGTNRIAFHFPGVVTGSAAHFLRRRVSPGMIAALYPLGIRFGEETAVASGAEWPTDLADLQVLVDDIPSPLYYVSPGQINYYVPMRLEPGTTSTFIVQRKSNGQILASGVIDIGVATPGFFTSTQNGQGQIAAINEDGSINTNTNGIARGSIISLYATGQGFIPGAPADGKPASGLIRTPDTPRVVIGSGFVPDENIQYSGLAPGYVGLWQINVRVPMSVPPSSATDVVVTLKSIPSNQPENGGGVIRTTIAVK